MYRFTGLTSMYRPKEKKRKWKREIKYKNHFSTFVLLSWFYIYVIYLFPFCHSFMFFSLCYNNEMERKYIAFNDNKVIVYFYQTSA